MKYELSKRSEPKSFDAYLASLSSPIDSFLEGHVLESQFYHIVTEGQEIGSFAIHNGSLFTKSHIVGGTRRHEQEVFADILGQYRPSSALVPTCDGFIAIGYFLN